MSMLINEDEEALYQKWLQENAGCLHGLDPGQNPVRVVGLI